MVDSFIRKEEFLAFDSEMHSEIIAKIFVWLPGFFRQNSVE